MKVLMGMVAVCFNSSFSLDFRLRLLPLHSIILILSRQNVIISNSCVNRICFITLHAYS